MGGAVSSGESNDDLIDNLLEADYIKSPLVERVFRAVDRAFYYTEPYKQNAYKDLAWKDGNLHMSAPCIYSEVLENLDLRTGMCFLNIGSGTGYFSTMCGLILGKTGVNHGVELYPDVVNYARTKLDEFVRTSAAVDEFDFCCPEFTVGNCLDSIPAPKRYDRIYCGAACPNNYVEQLIDMVKIGGMCIVPLGDSLVQITRTEEEKFERKALLPVSFATLIAPREDGSRTPVELPEWSPRTLTDLCRSEIRSTLRQTIQSPDTKSSSESSRQKKRKRRQERRQASRLVVVPRRRSGGGDTNGDNGFVAIAYSMGSNNSSDEERQQESAPEQDQSQEENSQSGVTSEYSSPEDGDSSPSANENLEADAVNEDSNDQDDASQTPKQNPVASVGAGNGESSTRGNGVTIAIGSCPIYATSREKKVTAENGGHNNKPEEGEDSKTVSARAKQETNGSSRSSRSARTYSIGGQSLFNRIRQIVRSRERHVESLRRLPRFLVSAESNSSRDGEDNNDASAPVNQDDSDDLEAVKRSDAVTSSDNSSSPSAPSTSTSDEETGADSSKKRCRNEMNESSSDEEKIKEPKPDPLLVNTYSVQMRKKILDLPLPPALKVYLNFDRNLHY